jgi:uncharacterized protein with HEPN domain
MTNNELILLFKRDSGMSEKDWKRFCTRYATRDILVAIECIKEYYSDTDVAVFFNSHSFKKSLQAEMQKAIK